LPYDDQVRWIARKIGDDVRLSPSTAERTSSLPDPPDGTERKERPSDDSAESLQSRGDETTITFAPTYTLDGLQRSLGNNGEEVVVNKSDATPDDESFFSCH